MLITITGPTSRTDATGRPTARYSRLVLSRGSRASLLVGVISLEKSLSGRIRSGPGFFPIHPELRLGRERVQLDCLLRRRTGDQPAPHWRARARGRQRDYDGSGECGVVAPGNDSRRKYRFVCYCHNVIHCQWPDTDVIGIGVFSQVANWLITNAVVVDNVVNMSPPDGVTFSDYSAGIDIRGFAQGIVVGNNTIRGRARAAVAVDVFNGGTPRNTAFVLNRFDDFDPSVPGVIVGDGVTDTLILGQKGTVNDQGINTVILPFGGRARSEE